MGLDDKIENKKDQVVGKAKAGVGDAADDPELQAEGEAQHSKGSLKEAGEKVKDAARNLKEGITGRK